MKPTLYEESKDIISATAEPPLEQVERELTLYKLKGLKTFAPLRECPELESLWIRSETTLPPFDEMTSLKNLRSLKLDGVVKVKELKALEKFPALEFLEIGKDYKRLEGLKLPLKELKIPSANLSDLSFLEKFENLEELELGSGSVYCSVDDKMDFTNAAGISRLWCLSRKLTRLDNMASLVNLRSLYVGANKKLTALNGLENLQKLEALACFRTSIQDLNPLRGLALKYLSAGETKLKTLTGLDSKELIHLSVNKTNIKDLESFNDFPALEYLSLANNSLNKLDGIERFQKLKTLILWGNENPLDLSPLLELPNLEMLELRGNPLEAAQFEPLLSIPTLKGVNLTDTPLGDSKVEFERAQERGKDSGMQLFNQSLKWFGYCRGLGIRELDYYLHAYKGEKSPWYDKRYDGYGE